MTARALTCIPSHQTRARAPIELCIRVPICGKTPPTIDVLRRGEKRQFASMVMRVLRRFLAVGVTRRARRMTGPRCAGSPSGRPAKTRPPKTRASIPLAPLHRVKIQTEAIALRLAELSDSLHLESSHNK